MSGINPTKEEELEELLAAIKKLLYTTDKVNYDYRSILIQTELLFDARMAYRKYLKSDKNNKRLSND
jgi:hypothetical protein